MEFDEARHYQAGDDIRAIDWRVTARTGKTHTKIYREEKERPVFVLVDLSNSMYFGSQFLFKSVQAAHLAALVAWSAQKRGDRIGGLIFNQQQHLEFKPMTRQKAVLSLLHGLLQLHKPQQQQPAAQGSEQANFSNACARLRRLAHPGSLVVLISDFQHIDDSAKSHISRISRHCEVVCYPVSDPFEHQLPQVSGVQPLLVTDGTQQAHINLGEKRTMQEYATLHRARFDRIYALLEHGHCKLCPISAALPLQQQLQGRPAPATGRA